MKKIILDCDPGMDDSMAIVMAAKSEVLDLLAVTTVNGNYPAEITAKNAAKVLEMAWAHRHSCGARHGAANGASLPQGSVFPRCRWSGGKLSA